MLPKAPRWCARGHCLIRIACLLCASFTFVHHPAPAGAASTDQPAAYECVGDACASATLTWEEEGQRFRADNSSDRRVRFEVETFAGQSAVTVEPRESAYLSVKGFNGPYRADYE